MGNNKSNFTDIGKDSIKLQEKAQQYMMGLDFDGDSYYMIRPTSRRDHNRFFNECDLLVMFAEQLLSEQRQNLIAEINAAQKEPHPVKGLVWVAMSRKLLDNLLADKPNE